jgi:hypothetical protein
VHAAAKNAAAPSARRMRFMQGSPSQRHDQPQLKADEHR